MSRSHVAAFAIVLTGPPGAGKTSVLTALVDALSDDNVPHAAVDVEALVWAHPALDHEQRLRHVQTVCRLYREVGYRLLLLADTIETDADLAGLLDAVGAKQHVSCAWKPHQPPSRSGLWSANPRSGRGLPGSSSTPKGSRRACPACATSRSS